MLDIDDRRERLLASASGRVLDIKAAGDNDRWYRNVHHVVRAKPSQLATTTGTFDTIVCDLVLCSVDDVYSTLLRIGELLAKNGRLLVLEHVRSTGLRGRVQDAAAGVWGLVAGGCRPNRDAVDLLRRNGFAVTDCDRFVVRGATPLVHRAVSAIAIRRVRGEGVDE